MGHCLMHLPQLMHWVGSCAPASFSPKKSSDDVVLPTHAERSDCAMPIMGPPLITLTRSASSLSPLVFSRMKENGVPTRTKKFPCTPASPPPTVTARVEPDSILIGDRFDYIIDVEKDLVQVVEFPEFDPRDGKIELVENCPVDTLERDGRHLRLRKRYTLAAFEEGKWNLGRPAVLYADKNIVDTLYTSDSLRLDVGTFQIDTAKQTIYDLKPQRTLPLRAEEITGYLFGGLFLLLNLAALLFALRYHLSKRGKHLSDLFKPAPPAPTTPAARMDSTMFITNASSRDQQMRKSPYSTQRRRRVKERALVTPSPVGVAMVIVV